jgi:hypothetical protein
LKTATIGVVKSEFLLYCFIIRGLNDTFRDYRIAVANCDNRVVVRITELRSLEKLSRAPVTNWRQRGGTFSASTLISTSFKDVRANAPFLKDDLIS